MPAAWTMPTQMRRVGASRCFANRLRSTTRPPRSSLCLGLEEQDLLGEEIAEVKERLIEEAVRPLLKAEARGWFAVFPQLFSRARRTALKRSLGLSEDARSLRQGPRQGAGSSRSARVLLVSLE